jgi:hypothetical protein
MMQKSLASETQMASDCEESVYVQSDDELRQQIAAWKRMKKPAKTFGPTAGLSMPHCAVWLRISLPVPLLLLTLNANQTQLRSDTTFKSRIFLDDSVNGQRFYRARTVVLYRFEECLVNFAVNLLLAESGTIYLLQWAENYSIISSN